VQLSAGTNITAVVDKPMLGEARCIHPKHTSLQRYAQDAELVIRFCAVLITDADLEVRNASPAR
jgi:hypothetical protein